VDSSLLMLYISRLRLQLNDSVVQKALKSIEKNIPLSHILAEVLLYNYLKSKDYRFVSIEETVGYMKCDVYAEEDGNSVCIEVETLGIPSEYVLEGLEYLVARHVKKIVYAAKSGIHIVSFAYPFGAIPLIPIEFLKEPEDRDKENLVKLFNIVRKYYPLDLEDLSFLKQCTVGDVYIYDIASMKVVSLTKEKALNLVNFYLSFFYEDSYKD